MLAYSTVSQLGYMFLAVGAGAYVAAIFHMITHAFFKALLFLGAGSVIHGLHDEQDMRWMGRLRKFLPVTAATFIVGWLAIAGVPPFAGFWSKDDILLFALADSPALYTVGLDHRPADRVLHDPPGDDGVLRRGALAGPLRRARRPRRHASRTRARGSCSSRSWSWPSCRSSAAAIELPFNDAAHRLEHWLEPVVEFGEANIEGTWADDHMYLLLVVAVVVALAGIIAGWLVYQKRRVKAVEPAILANAWYYDQAVTEFTGGPGREAFEATAWFDANVVDGAVDGTGRVVREYGRRAAQGPERLRPRLRRDHRRRRRRCCSPGSSSPEGFSDGRRRASRSSPR